MPYSDQCGISRKIEDSKERLRLRQLVNELTIPEGMGVIVRTAGEGKKSPLFCPRSPSPAPHVGGDPAEGADAESSHHPVSPSRISSSGPSVIS